MNCKRLIAALFLVSALALTLAACSSSDILPPKDGVQSATTAPMPTPTPTPMPTPFAGGIDAVEISQAPGFGADDDTGAPCPMKNFVSGRDTVVFVHLSEALGHAPDARDYLELYRGSELLCTLAPDASSSEDCLRYFLKHGEDFSLDAGEYTARAVADDAAMSRGFTLTDTRRLNVLLLPVRGCFGGEIGYPGDGWQDAFAFLQSLWPLRNDGVNAVKGQGLDLSNADYDLRTARGLWNAWEAVCARVGMLGEYDLVVGFVSGEMGENADCACFGRDGVVLLDASQENAQAVLSRFAAQSFGANDAPEGALSAELWNFLFDALQGERTLSPVPQGSTGRLRLAGLLGRDGSFTLRGAVCADENAVSVTLLRDSGDYSLRISGADGKTLYLVYFEPDFSGADGAFAPVDLVIPVPDGAEKLELCGGTDALLYTRDMTPPEQVGMFSALPTDEALRGIARFEWVIAAAEAPAEEPPEEPEESDEALKLPPEPDYELYMCYDGVRLLVYRGKTSYTELDMPSLPKPEECTFLLLTSCGGKSAVVESEAFSLG